MVQNADDQYGIVFDHVEYPVLAMHKATICLAEVRDGYPGVGMIRQKGEGCIETMHVGVADLLAKLREAEFVDLAQVGNRSIAENDVSHALHAAWR